jgi:hypothetical protein
MHKNRKANRAANANANGHSDNTSKNSKEAAVESSGSSDLEDAVGSPNTAGSGSGLASALVSKVRRKSGLSNLDQELVRIVGQHLHNIGLKSSAEVLMAEAGTQLIHPTAANFKKLVLNGEWSQAVKSKTYHLMLYKKGFFKQRVFVYFCYSS